MAREEGRRSGNGRFIRIHSVCLRDDRRRQNISGPRVEKQVTASVDARVGERVVFTLAETDCNGVPLLVESTGGRLGFHYYAGGDAENEGPRLGLMPLLLD